MRTRRARAAAGVYALFARLFPPVLRRHYGPEMVDAFAQAFERRLEQEGGWSALRFAFAAWWDAALAGSATRLRSVRRPEAASRARTVRTSTLTGRWMGDWLLDVRFAIRSLRRNPIFTAVGALTLAIGMAGTASMLSIADGLLVRQDAVRESDRMVTIWELRNPGATSGPEGRKIPRERYEAYREATGDVFEGLAGHSYETFVVTTTEGALNLMGFVTSANYFALLGLTPLTGRLYDTEGEATVVLSERLWRQSFGADPSVIGRSIAVNSRMRTVAGVAPHGFRGTMAGFAGDVWLPGVGDDFLLVPIGRLRAGVDRNLAEERVSDVARSIPPWSPGLEISGVRFDGLLWRADIEAPIRTGVGIMFAAAALLLLIACVNIAAMTLARSHDRRRELAVRMAIGAGAGRLVRLLITESVLLAVLGGSLGILIGAGATRALSAMPFPGVDVPIALDVAPTPGILLVSFALTVLAGVLFGLGPALGSSRADLSTSLKEGAHGPGQAGYRRLLVTGQFAVATVLLLTAGLFVRSFTNVLDVPLGFEPDGMLTATLPLQGRYGEEDRPQLYARLLEGVRAIPGVEAAGLGSFVLLGGSNANSEGRRTDAGDDAPGVSIGYNIVDPGYFPASGTELVEGRFFDRADADREGRVAVINETLAERFWPGQSAVGRSYATSAAEYEVVGVVRDGVYVFQYETPLAFAFYDADQLDPGDMALHVRASGDLAPISTSIRQIVRDLDPNLAVSFRTMHDIVAWSQLPFRFLAVVTTLFALVGLALAAIGVYGMLAVHVAQSRREFGVRMAVGARPRDVLLIVVRRGAVLAVAGCALGAVLALGAGRILSSILFGVSAVDPLTFVLAPLVLIATALAATAGPARRASRVSTSALLREE